MAGISEAVLVAATVGNGLLAGVFFGFSSGVVPGLRRVDDRSFVTVVRAVNLSIVNGLFLLVFLGAPILTMAATNRWNHVRTVASTAAPVVLAIGLAA